MFQPRHVLAAALSVCSIVAQSISSNLVGVTVDPADAVVPGAEIRLVEQASGAERTTRANESGLFRLNNLPPGTYRLSIVAKGFKTQTQSGLQLASSETRDLGRLMLTIGSVDQTISVGAQVTPVQTASSEKSSLIDGKQLTDVAIKGRDMFSFMRLIPGVVDTQMGRDVTSPGAIGGLTINGNNTGKNFTVDGITSLDTGCNNCVASYVPNLAPSPRSAFSPQTIRRSSAEAPAVRSVWSPNRAVGNFTEPVGGRTAMSSSMPTVSSTTRPGSHGRAIATTSPDSVSAGQS